MCLVLTPPARLLLALKSRHNGRSYLNLIKSSEDVGHNTSPASLHVTSYTYIPVLTARLSGLQQLTGQ
jgi:hypothetical protein